MRLPRSSNVYSANCEVSREYNYNMFAVYVDFSSNAVNRLFSVYVIIQLGGEA